MQSEQFWALALAIGSVLGMLLYTDSKVNQLEREIHDLRSILDSLPHTPIPVGLHHRRDAGFWCNPVTVI